MALKFHDVKVIEDISELINRREVTLTENHLFAGPLKIQDAEEWESWLCRQKTPYVLIQAETTIESDDSMEKSQLMFRKGYFIFTKEESQDERN